MLASDAALRARPQLLITGILAFIAPGRIGQVVAGLFITLGFLLAYQRVQPYEDKSYRRIGLFMSLILFLFFVFALLVKAGVDTMSSAAGTAAFNDACLGLLTAGTFTLPVVVVAMRLRWPLEAADDEEEETEKTTAAAPDVLRARVSASTSAAVDVFAGDASA